MPFILYFRHKSNAKFPSSIVQAKRNLFLATKLLESSKLIIDDKMPNVNGLFMGTKLLEINPKLNVIIMCDFANLKCNYKFNILLTHYVN